MLDSTDDEDEAHGIPNLVMRFQSIGDNCEFGIVQRYCGCEPSSLFRFATSDIENITAAISDGLDAYGADGDLAVYEGDKVYWCLSNRHKFAHRTDQYVGQVDAASVLDREYGRIAHLKRKFLIDLAEGQKILVRKGPPSETLDEVLDLVAAIRQHGPAIVIRVEVAPSAGCVGEVRWHCPGVMLGYVGRFSPYEGGMKIDLEPWIALCRNAVSLAANSPATPLPAYERFFRLRAASDAIKHTSKYLSGNLSSFPIDVDADQLALGKINVFSAWIWVPAGFEGEQIFGFVKIDGVYHRLANRDADLTLREGWQRVWISAVIPPQVSTLKFGLFVRAGGGQAFWSTDWRVSDHPIPLRAPPPAAEVRPGLRDRLFGRRA